MNDLFLFLGRNIQVWKNMYACNNLLNEVLTRLLDAICILSWLNMHTQDCGISQAVNKKWQDIWVRGALIASCLCTRRRFNVTDTDRDLFHILHPSWNWLVFFSESIMFDLKHDVRAFSTSDLSYDHILSLALSRKCSQTGSFVDLRAPVKVNGEDTVLI